MVQYSDANLGCASSEARYSWLVEFDVYVLHRRPYGFVDVQIGSTSLHFASGKGHLPVVMALLERGADVGARDKVR